MDLGLAGCSCVYMNGCVQPERYVAGGLPRQSGAKVAPRRAVLPCQATHPPARHNGTNPQPASPCLHNHTSSSVPCLLTNKGNLFLFGTAQNAFFLLLQEQEKKHERQNTPLYFPCLRTKRYVILLWPHGQFRCPSPQSGQGARRPR